MYSILDILMRSLDYFFDRVSDFSLLCSKDIRRSIARTLTVYNETQRAELKNHFKKAKRKPLDLRPKLTRTLRRRLLPSEEAKMTLRQKKRLQHFGPRKFAVKN